MTWWHIYLTQGGGAVAYDGRKVTSTFPDLFILLEALRRYGPGICLYDDYVSAPSPFCTFTSSQLALMPHKVSDIRDYVYDTYPELFI